MIIQSLELFNENFSEKFLRVTIEQPKSDSVRGTSAFSISIQKFWAYFPSINDSQHDIPQQLRRSQMPSYGFDIKNSKKRPERQEEKREVDPKINAQYFKKAYEESKASAKDQYQTRIKVSGKVGSTLKMKTSETIRVPSNSNLSILCRKAMF